MDNEYILRWLSFYGTDWVEFQQIVIDGVLDGTEMFDFEIWCDRKFIDKDYHGNYKLSDKAIQQLNERK